MAYLECILKVYNKLHSKRRRLLRRLITAAKYLLTSLLSSAFPTRCCRTQSITQTPWKRRAARLICLKATVNPFLVVISMPQPLSRVQHKVKSSSRISTDQWKGVVLWWLKISNSLRSIQKVWWSSTTILYPSKLQKPSWHRWLSLDSSTSSSSPSLLTTLNLLRNPHLITN